jgi:hypothetical protein
MKATNAIQLQQIGWVHAVPAGELTVGDTTVWNYGGTAVVEAIGSASERFVCATLRSEKGSTEPGYVGERRMKKDRLVGVTRETYLRHRPDDTSRKVNYHIL